MSDDWGDIDDGMTRMGRRAASASVRSDARLSRDERFIITLAASAAVMLVIGVAVGFALGRATAKQGPTAVATSTPEATVTPVAEATVSAEVTVPVEPTPTPVVEPTQTAEPLPAPKPTWPDDGDRINADRVTLKWSKVTDPNGGPVKYAFEIQTRVSGKWTNAQVIDDLTKNSYSVRVLTNLRRWRVWAIDAGGKAGEKSDWSTYAHTVVKTSTTTSSTTTTSH